MDLTKLTFYDILVLGEGKGQGFADRRGHAKALSYNKGVKNERERN